MATSGATLLAPIVATPFVSEAAVKRQSLVSCNPVTNVTHRGDALMAVDVDLRVPLWTSAIPCFVAAVLCILSAIWIRASRFETAVTQSQGN